jgi:hypothetical protein
MLHVFFINGSQTCGMYTNSDSYLGTEGVVCNKYIGFFRCILLA